MMNGQLIERELKLLGLDNIEDMESFAKYKELLLEWNEKINLTSITESDEVDVKHFVDSISIFKTGLFNAGTKVIDVGTGAGFPGIPMKIYNRDIELVLMDSLNKRINFLNTVIDELNLENTIAIHGRAEEMARKVEYREQFDVCVSRAVANLSTLSEYCLPFVKLGGYFVSMKGPDVQEELSGASRAISELGGKIVDTIVVNLDYDDIVHTLVVIEKVSHTGKKYPRGGGKPKNSPL